MSSHFDWPVPPHLEIAGDSGIAAAVATLTLADGRQQSGRLAGFEPETAKLDFLADGATAATSIPFSGIRLLRLSEPVELRRLPLSGGRVDIRAPSSRQKCQIHFHQGDSLQAESAGFVSMNYGMFLYLAGVASGDDLKLSRCFIPTDAIRSYQFGDPIGKILVEENFMSIDLLNAGLARQEQLRAQKLGDYLQQLGILTPGQLDDALDSQRIAPELKLGEALVQARLISEEQLTMALRLQERDRKALLGDILVDMKAVDADTLSRGMAQKLGIPFISLDGYAFDPALARSIPPELARRLHAVPLYRTEARLVVALDKPAEAGDLQQLAQSAGMKIDPVMTTTAELDDALARIYGASAQTEAATPAQPGSGAALRWARQGRLLRLAGRPDGLLLICGHDAAARADLQQQLLRRADSSTAVRVSAGNSVQEITGALDAALDGELVLHELDVSTAAEGVAALLRQSGDPHGVAEALLGAVGVRTAQRLCQACRKPYAASEQQLQALALAWCGASGASPALVAARWRRQYAREHGTVILFQATGCPQCGDTGHAGNVVLHELLEIDAAARQKIRAGEMAGALASGRLDDSRTLRQDAIEKILQGQIDWVEAETGLNREE